MPCHATTPMGWHMAHGIACGYSTRLPHTRFRCESDLAHLLPQVVVCSDARDQPELRFQPVDVLLGFRKDRLQEFSCPVVLHTSA